MTADLFEYWFNNYFVPAVREYPKLSGLEDKAILTLDNATSHTKFFTSKNGSDSNIHSLAISVGTPLNIHALIVPFILIPVYFNSHLCSKLNI